MGRIIRWNKDEHITFTGRNGTGFCTGVDILKLVGGSLESTDRLMLSPITSRGVVGRCDIDIPLDKLGELIEVLKEIRKGAG